MGNKSDFRCVFFAMAQSLTMQIAFGWDCGIMITSSAFCCYKTFLTAILKLCFYRNKHARICKDWRNVVN